MSQVQPSKQPPGGGTLAYPNTSLVEDTLYLVNERIVVLDEFKITHWDQLYVANIFTFERGMTWEQYFNSKYAQNVSEYYRCESSGVQDLTSPSSITYTLSENDTIILQFAGYGGGGQMGVQLVSMQFECDIQMKLSDKIPTTDTSYAEFVIWNDGTGSWSE